MSAAEQAASEMTTEQIADALPGGLCVCAQQDCVCSDGAELRAEAAKRLRKLAALEAAHDAVTRVLDERLRGDEFWLINSEDRILPGGGQ